MEIETGLNSRQKAAVIVRLLLDDDEAVNLSRLDTDSQTLLAEAMASMALIDRQTRDEVITEFCDMLEAVGVTFPGDLDGTLAMLAGQLSTSSSDRLRRQAALSGRGDPWERLAGLPREDLLSLAQTEAVELVALMLSRLPVAQASAVFSSLPRDRARVVAQTVSLSGNVTVEALDRVGLILLHAADSLPRAALDPPPANRMGAILNFATADLRDDVLEALDLQDREFAGVVRKSIFIFAQLPDRLLPRDVPKLVREVDQAVLLRALSATAPADAAAAEFLLANLSQRMSDALRDEREELPALLPRDIDPAMSEVIAVIRRMEEAGEITLIAPKEEDY